MFGIWLQEHYAKIIMFSALIIIITFALLYLDRNSRTVYVILFRQNAVLLLSIFLRANYLGDILFYLGIPNYDLEFRVFGTEIPVLELYRPNARVELYRYEIPVYTAKSIGSVGQVQT